MLCRLVYEITHWRTPLLSTVYVRTGRLTTRAVEVTNSRLKFPPRRKRHKFGTLRTVARRDVVLRNCCAGWMINEHTSLVCSTQVLSAKNVRNKTPLINFACPLKVMFFNILFFVKCLRNEVSAEIGRF